MDQNSPYRNVGNYPILPIFEQALALSGRNREQAENPSISIPKATAISPNMKLFLPCYTEVLGRSPEDGVVTDDLDQLQMDLEYLLTTVVLQRKALRFKRKLLKHNKNHPKSKKSKHRFTAKKKCKNKKRFKQAPAVKKTLRVNDAFRKLETPRATVVKNDTSDRYWLSVEPLCGDITKDNLVFLDKMIRECSGNTEVIIPDVGEHFASKWAESSLDYERFLGGVQKSLEQRMAIDLYKDHTLIQENCIPSSLKHHLLKAFTEEKSCKGPFLANKFSKLNNHSRFHKKLRQEFIKKRHLKNKSMKAVEDEVLFEIRKSVLQLKLVNDHNLTELNNLKAVVLMDLKKQEAKESLERLDEEMMVMYNKIITLKEKQGVNTNESYSKISAEDEAKAKRILERQNHFQKELIDFTVSAIY